jgi:serpin B
MRCASRGLGVLLTLGLGCNGSGGGVAPDAGPAPDTGAASDTGDTLSASNCIAGVCPLISSRPRETLAALIPEAADQVTGNNTFATSLYRKLRATEPNANLFYSPHSISTALAMTYAGARGTTAAQMATTLDFRLPQAQLHRAFNALDQELARRGKPPGATDGDPFKLTVANALWGARGFTFLPEFLDVLAVNYGAGMQVLDFASDVEAARRTINAWVEEKTAGKIKDLLRPGDLTPATALVLTNAIYFKASWASAFLETNTADRPFHLGDGMTVSVPTMTQDHPFPFLDNGMLQAVTLPFVGEQLTMLVMVPAAGMLDAVEAALTPTAIQDIVDGQRPTAVLLKLPKFKFGAQFFVKQALSQLGMPDAFTEAADFTGITAAPPLAIRDIVHKAFIGIDEKGAEAAAATAVVTLPPSASPAMIELNVDRPFLFFIRDRPTGAILFAGCVLDPR